MTGSKPKRRKMTVGIFRLIAVAAVLTVGALHAGAASAQTSPATRLIDYVNSARIANGLPVLIQQVRLTNAALAHVRDMAENNIVGHEGSDGSTLEQRVTRAGYAWTAVAENVAAGQTTVQQVIREWMKSPGHRENILNTDFREIGAGHVAVSNGGVSRKYSHFWVVVFGRR
jgi:uncharacterized protein YkwD